MGNENSSQREKFIQDFQKQCTKIREMKDLRFGDVSIYQTSQNSLIMVKSLWCNNSQEHDIAMNNCELRSKFQNQNLIRLLGYHSNSQNQWCGDFSKITVYLEFFDYTLEKSIETRRQTNQYFTEAELWKILFTITKLGQVLEKNNKIFGDIRPCNIQLGDDIKMAEYGILKPDQTGYQRQVNNNEIAYLAPEQLNQNPQFNSKTDIYSLGVTLLECSTLQSCKNLYKNNRIDVGVLNQLLERIKQLGFSIPWYRMVRELLKESPDERPSYDDIYDVLKQYEVQIINLQPFSLMYQQLPQQQQQQPISPYRPSFQQQQQQQQQFQQPVIQPLQQPYQQIQQPSYMNQNQSLPQQQFQHQQQLPHQPQQPISTLQQQQQLQSLPLPQQQQQSLPQQQLPQQPIMSQYPPQYQQQQMIQPPQFQQQSYVYNYQQQPQQQYLNELANAQSNYFMPQHVEQSPYHTLQSPQNMTSTMYYQDEEQDDGLNEVDRKIQQALKRTRETELRNKQTPNYY